MSIAGTRRNSETQETWSNPLHATALRLQVQYMSIRMDPEQQQKIAIAPSLRGRRYSAKSRVIIDFVADM
jgi:hypothetical protein